MVLIKLVCIVDSRPACRCSIDESGVLEPALCIAARAGACAATPGSLRVQAICILYFAAVKLECEMAIVHGLAQCTKPTFGVLILPPK